MSERAAHEGAAHEGAVHGGRFRGKTALCTGAGRRAGLGAAILRALAAEGCRVVFTDLLRSTGPLQADHIGSAEEIEQLASEVRAAGGTAACMSLDVRDERQVEAVIAATVARFERLDFLINNAGVGFLIEPLVETAEERWRTVLDVNLTGAFLCTKHAARQMIRQGSGGRIVNIASQAAKSGHLHMAAYTASKHGMIGLTRSAALELGPHGITVNAICPNHVTTGLGAVQNEYFAKLRGFADTEAYLADMRQRIPLRRVGLAEDTAKACVFLCSEAASYVTGEAMNVSGGIEMH
jgi:meso-butanediol dehydrogenase/(S,S)-butanediol dehydrogenase/diacetyl reductase